MFRPAAILLMLCAVAAIAAAQEAPTIYTIPKWEVPIELPDDTTYQLDELFVLEATIIEAAVAVNADQLRIQEKVTGAGLTVAVIDSGLDRKHCDFKAAGKIVAVHNFTTADGGAASIVVDRKPHGTHITGIIAANSKKRTGIAPDAHVVVLKVLDRGGATPAAMRDALQWVIDHGATYNTKVVNMSLAGGHYVTDAIGPEIRSRVAELRRKGVAVVISSGNAYKEAGDAGMAEGMGHPGIIRESISVGATYDANIGGDLYDNNAEAFTTLRDRYLPVGQRLHASTDSILKTDIFAPGALIRSSLAGTSCKPGWMKGTSQAAAVVSGIVLLLQEFALKHHGRYATVDEIEASLIKGARLQGDLKTNHDDNVAHTEKSYPIADSVAAAKELNLLMAQNNLSAAAAAYRKAFPKYRSD